MSIGGGALWSGACALGWAEPWRRTPNPRDAPAAAYQALESRNATWFEDDVYETLRAHDAVLCVAETEPGDKKGGTEAAPVVAPSSWGFLR